MLLSLVLKDQVRHRIPLNRTVHEQVRYALGWMSTKLGNPPAQRRDSLPHPKQELPPLNMFSLVKGLIGACLSCGSQYILIFAVTCKVN